MQEFYPSSSVRVFALKTHTRDRRGSGGMELWAKGLKGYMQEAYRGRRRRRKEHCETVGEGQGGGWVKGVAGSLLRSDVVRGEPCRVMSCGVWRGGICFRKCRRVRARELISSRCPLMKLF